MMSLDRRWICVSAVAAFGLVLSAGLTGCGGEPEDVAITPVAAPRPSTPPPPPAPAFTPVADLMAKLSIDERVVLPEDQAPPNDPDRIALLGFFDAFARGDAVALREVLPMLDRAELDAMVESGVWDESVAGITEIAIQTGTSPYGDKCALAIFEADGDYQAQLWYYNGEGGQYVFDAVSSPPHMIDRLYGEDPIALWHDILEEETRLAMEPDDPYAIPQQNLDDEEDEEDGFYGGSPGGGNPNTPAPGGGGRRPPPPPRKPPGAR